MKAIMISIKPKWVAKILNGEKTIEIRKTMPKCDLPIDVYIYCTKANNLFYVDYEPYGGAGYVSTHLDTEETTNFKGKVVAKFTLNKVERIIPQNFTAIKEHEILKQSCLREKELFDYISKNNGEPDNPFYVWHISNLVIFDRPKELSEFRPSYQGKCLTSKCKYCDERGYCDAECRDERLTKAPQSYMFIEVE